MRWKRRQSTWPAAMAMVVLLLLTLAAPYAWKRVRIARLDRASAVELAKGSTPASEPTKPAGAAEQADAASTGDADAIRRHTTRGASHSSSVAPPPLPPLEDPSAVPDRRRYVRPGASHLAPNPALIAPVAAPIVAGDDYADDVALDLPSDHSSPADIEPRPDLPEKIFEPDQTERQTAEEQASNEQIAAEQIAAEQIVEEQIVEEQAAEEIALLQDAPSVVREDYIAVQDLPVAPPQLIAPAPIEDDLPTGPPTTAAPVELDFSALIGVRDSIASLLGEAVEAAEKIEHEAVAKLADNANELADNAAEIARRTHQTVRVRVENSSDRLAMIPEQSILIRPIEGSPATDAGIGSLTAEPVDAAETAFQRNGGPAKPLRLAERTRAPARPALTEHPNALISQLLALRKSDTARRWCDAVLDEIGKLTTESVGTVTADAYGRLEELLEQGARLAAEQQEPRLMTQWIRSRQAIARRMPLWRLLSDPAFHETTSQTVPPGGDATELTAALQEVAAQTAGDEMGAAWREYLLLDEVADLAAQEPSGDPSALRDAAQRVLARMTANHLTSGQRKFLRTIPLRSLRRNLEPWAAGPVRLSTVAAVIERYENDGSMRYGRGLAQLLLRLRWSGVDAYERLADELEKHYRLPNVRLAVTDDLMNRLIPNPEATTVPVRDRVRGADIRGRSQTSTELSVHLLPADYAWRIVLGAEGDVRSRTYSDTWPARVRNAGRLQFEASKEIVLTPRGLSAKPAAAKVEGRNRLVGVDSQFDPIPLLGTLARSVARQRHDRNRGPALAEVKSKVTRATRQRIDEETQQKLVELEKKFQERIQAPLEQLAVSAEPVEMYTSDERAVMRLQMAGEQQLSAHTPRPSAPSDSLISVQAHQSALNNALAGLGLAGRRMAATELYELFAKKVPGGAAPPPADLSARARIEFARHDAIRVAYHSGRIELILSIAELARGRDRIRNFEVHAFYVPQIDGLQVDLVRDGTLQFSGARLRTGPRVVLHSVFGKLLHKATKVPVLAEGLEEDPRFAGLMVTQLVIDDGWLAVALGPEHPQRVAWRTRSVR